MQDVLYIERLEQAAALLKPARLAVLKQMVQPVTCTELGERLGQSPQAAYYHVKALERAGAVRKVSERRVRGVVEGTYQAAARSFWMSPKLVGDLGGNRATRDQLSLGYLISLAEEVQADVGRLGARAAADEIPSLGLAGQIELDSAADRKAFFEDVKQVFQDLAVKYGAKADGNGELYRLALICYPKEEDG